jgi:hypothetical protein
MALCPQCSSTTEPALRTYTYDKAVLKVRAFANEKELMRNEKSQLMGSQTKY